MKRAFALMLALLLCCAATAETREYTISIEGEPETYTETLYQSTLGFSFWYDAEALTVEEDESEGGGSLIIFPTGNDLPIYLELMTPEAVGMLPWKFLETNATPETEYFEDITDNDYDLRYFSRDDEETQQSFFAVESSGNFVAACGVWPLEAEEGWGTLFRHLIRTIDFDPPPASESGIPITVQWQTGPAPDNCETFAADDSGYAVAVVFSAARPLADFRVLALEFEGFDAGSRPVFSQQKLLSLESLSPGRPLVVEMAFSGEMPNNGIMYTDPESGFVYRFAVEISGKDGSPVLSPL